MKQAEALSRTAAAAAVERVHEWIVAVSLRSKELGPAACLAFLGYLAVAVRWEEGRVVLYTGHLAGHFGCKRTAAARWLANLKAAGLIHMFEDNDQTGVVDLWVHDPRECIRQEPVRSDPQGTFAFAAEECLPHPHETGVTERRHSVTPRHKMGSSVTERRHSVTGRHRMVNPNQVGSLPGSTQDGDTSLTLLSLSSSSSSAGLRAAVMEVLTTFWPNRARVPDLNEDDCDSLLRVVGVRSEEWAGRAIRGTADKISRETVRSPLAYLRQCLRTRLHEDGYCGPEEAGGVLGAKLRGVGDVTAYVPIVGEVIEELRSEARKQEAAKRAGAAEEPDQQDLARASAMAKELTQALRAGRISELAEQVEKWEGSGEQEG